MPADIPWSLRFLLLMTSAVTCIFIYRKLHVAKLKSADANFWAIFSLSLLILSLFPFIGIQIAKKIGFISPVNFIFLVIIFLLIIKCFMLSVSVADLQNKVEKLVVDLALRDYDKSKKRIDAENTEN